MPTFSRAWLLAVALTAIVTLGAAVAQTISPQIGGGINQGFDGGISGTGSVAAPAGSGSALLIDNTNPALLIDNTNPACLAGGC